MKNEIEKEINIHGNGWDKFHDGYFSSIKAAHPYLKEIQKIIKKTNPDIIIDLGGGTGFILNELNNKIRNSKIKFINLDCSENQLITTGNKNITTICKTIDKFNRSQYINDEKILFITRSVLHYYGKNKLDYILKNIKSKTNRGEYYIHQTASFRDKKSADCLNLIYRRMKTVKWYPTVEELIKSIKDAGWIIKSIKKAYPLKLSSSDLAVRYNLDDKIVKSIKNEILNDLGEIKNVFKITKTGFNAYLHYYIYTCVSC